MGLREYENPVGLKETALQGTFSESVIGEIKQLCKELQQLQQKPDENHASMGNDPNSQSKFFQSLLDAGFPLPHTEHLNLSANIAAADTRKNVPVPGLSIQNMKGREYDIIISIMGDALLEFVSDVTEETASRVYEMVIVVVKVLLLDIIKDACYCNYTRTIQQTCVYCDLHVMAGLSTDGSNLRKRQKGFEVRRDGGVADSRASIGLAGYDALKCIVQGIRDSAELAGGSNTGSLALLLITGISATWLIILSKRSARIADQDIECIGTGVTKYQPIYCTNLEIKCLKSASYLAVAEKVTSMGHYVNLPVLTIGWFAAQGGIALNSVDGEFGTRLDEDFHREVAEAVTGLHDYDRGLVDEITEKPNENPENNNYAVHGMGKCGAFGLLNRRLIDSATVTNDATEQIQLGILKDRFYQGDRWLIIWAANFTDYGVWAGTMGRTIQDGASMMYGYEFGVWINCITDLLSERGSGESANVYAWLNTEDAQQLTSLITKYMRQKFWDKGWLITVETSIWQWVSGRHKTCAIVSRSIRSAIYELQKNTHDLSSVASLSCPLLPNAFMGRFHNWLGEVQSFLELSLADTLDKACFYLAADAACAAKYIKPCSESHVELMSKACVEMYGIAVLCVAAALQPTVDMTNYFARFCDQNIAHFCVSTRTIVLYLCGCEENLAKYHASLFWGKFMDMGDRAWIFSQLFTHAERPKQQCNIERYVFCKCCKQRDADNNKLKN